jgi:preprotein translocase subunit Sec61beta
MIDMNTITIISAAITAISLAFAIFQYRKNRKIKQLRIYDALMLHKLSARALGAIQGVNDCNETLKRFSEDENTKKIKIIYDIGLSEGYCQSLLIETAKIFCNLKNITLQEIDSMINAGQLMKNYKDTYTLFARGNSCLASRNTKSNE